MMREGHLFGHEVHLGENVEVRHLQSNHGRHRLEAASYKLRRVCDEVRIQAVHSTYVPATVFHVVDECAQHWNVCEQLNLTWAV